MGIFKTFTTGKYHYKLQVTDLIDIEGQKDKLKNRPL